MGYNVIRNPPFLIRNPPFLIELTCLLQAFPVQVAEGTTDFFADGQQDTEVLFQKSYGSEDCQQ